MLKMIYKISHLSNRTEILILGNTTTVVINPVLLVQMMGTVTFVKGRYWDPAITIEDVLVNL